ncbi:hypothetical protein OCU04_008838 [Sclerotinia nivalis]|uniref:Uncharacterized protein n=1 Tax=Sclerotinia nivalis TaxID=352851 RepID=A0A9X0AGC1_9HELO|nr:hypothetical protein OCU04_008838 [Sclerotinia nivalis]
MIHESYSKLLVGAHSEGLRELVEAALDLKGLPCDKWVVKRKEDATFEDLKLELLFMSACIHPENLKHLIHGDLPKVYSNPSMPSMKGYMLSLKDGSKKEKRIFIYIHYLADAVGISPTPEELENVLDTAEIYIRGFEKPNDQVSYRVSKRIDEVLGKYESKPDGKRRYIKGPTQLKVISEWISIMRGRIAYERLQGRFQEPLARPISEVGFESSLQRLEQHKKHVSSNYIMNLIEAIFLRDGGVYKNEQFVIFDCIEPCHGTFGEILCSRYAQAYSTHGGGFSYCDAGGGVNNANKHDGAHWSMAKEDLLKSDWFEPTIKKEVAKMRKEIEMINRLFTSAEEQDIQIEEMRRAIKEMEGLEEKFEISQNKLTAVAKEYCDLMDPMLELIRLANSGEFDD